MALIAAPLLMVATACGSKDDGGHDASTAAARPAASRTGATTPAAHTSAPPGPAQRLAGLDGNLRPAEQYAQVLSALAPRCKEDTAHLATVVDTTLKSMKKKGGADTGDDEFSVLQKLEAAVPAGKPKADCAAQAAAYAAGEGN
ncbi:MULTISPECIES: hypothetical protein [unclassified Streptomyces]|uniref:hypothetical protein n=1 Tax=unclassified Streptomyces TaxID=2593676 RepID=UPI000FFF1DF7|nr:MULTISPECIES: hypothetical protein [unclassified Streptomyces]